MSPTIVLTDTPLLFPPLLEIRWYEQVLGTASKYSHLFSMFQLIRRYETLAHRCFPRAESIPRIGTKVTSNLCMKRCDHTIVRLHHAWWLHSKSMPGGLIRRRGVMDRTQIIEVSYQCDRGRTSMKRHEKHTGRRLPLLTAAVLPHRFPSLRCTGMEQTRGGTRRNSKLLHPAPWTIVETTRILYIIIMTYWIYLKSYRKIKFLFFNSTNVVCPPLYADISCWRKALTTEQIRKVLRCISQYIIQ